MWTAAAAAAHDGSELTPTTRPVEVTHEAKVYVKELGQVFIHIKLVDDSPGVLTLEGDPLKWTALRGGTLGTHPRKTKDGLTIEC